MKDLARFVLVAVLSVMAVGSRAGEKLTDGRGATLAFAFGKQPLVYSVRQKIENETYTSRGGSSSTMAPYGESAAQTVTTKTTLELRYKFRLTGMGQTKDGCTAVRYEPFNYEADLESTGATGHFVTTIRGLNVKSTQNGILIIDTDKDIGMAQAKPFKNDAVPLLLTGSMDINGTGEVKNFGGDLPFVDFWQQQMKAEIGLFDLRLPGHSVTNGESWQMVIPMIGSGGIKFDGGPLNHTNFFTLMDEDPAGNSDSSVASIKYSAPMICHDLSAYVEERGQSTHADLSEMEIHGFGTAHFDKKRGVFVDEDINKSALVTVTLLVQGRAVTSRSQIRTHVQIELLPASAQNPDGEMEKPAPKTL